MTLKPLTRNSGQVRRASRGFTLTEVMVTLPLVALLFGGTITLFTESQRVVQRTSVAVQASQDAAIGMQYVLGNTREAIQFALPPDTASINTNGMAFLPPDGNVNDYEASGTNAAGAAVTFNTAVELMMPAAATFKSGGATVTGLNVLDRSGNTYQVPPAGYDRTVPQLSGGTPINPPPGDIVCIYRGDGSGNASPGSGQFLWSVRCPAGANYNNPANYRLQKLCKLILTKHADGTPATDAVQFTGRNTPGTDIPSAMSYELECKLVCGDQTLIQGTQTNEAGNGSSVSALVGKCALLRNHN